MIGEYPRVSLYHTQERRLSSTTLGREYQLAVSLPESYASSQHRYPVVYLLDGDLVFGMASNLSPTLNWLSNVPELIIVGINYGIQSYQEFFQLRELDFKIPEVTDAPSDSHADRFLAALKQEIIPFIESEYRINPSERIIYGYSSSGFFVIYSLVNEPGLFRSYLAGSGDTDLSSPYMQTHDQKLVSREKKDKIDLFLSIGGLEDGSSQSSLSSFHDLVAAIEARNYPGVRLITEVYENEGHGAMGTASTYLNGLRKCFPTVNS
jgi:predicted alpha/beta superfamily hydrolase